MTPLILNNPEIAPINEEYQQLLAQTDPDSELERVVLKAIYDQGMKLPDAAQFFFPEANCKPDFVYHQAKIALFCDGSVHDHPERREQDRIKRENFQFDSGYSVNKVNRNAVLPQLLTWIKPGGYLDQT